jgi:hypothetical protein
MGYMRTKDKVKEYSQEEIDQLVVAQADDDSAWETPIHVQPIALPSLPLPTELAIRAAFMARLHRETNVEEWLVHIIQERLDFEESIYGDVKRELIQYPTREHEEHHRRTTQG